MSYRIASQLTLVRKFLLAAAGAAAVAGPVLIGLIDAPRGIAQATSLKFEVAAIKPPNPENRGIGIGAVPGGGLSAQGVNLRFLILYAYGIRDFQLSGGPGWMTSDRYDIEARPENSESPSEYSEQAAYARLRERLRTLLAERFQLVVRTEVKELPSYSLVIAKGGSRLKETPPDGPRRGLRRDRGLLLSIGAPLDHLVHALSDMLGRPVVDETGLAGKRFDFELKYAEEPEMSRGGVGLKPGAPPSDEASDPSSPSVFTAIQSQLGLKLEAKKGPADFLVVERAEKPSPN